MNAVLTWLPVAPIGRGGVDLWPIDCIPIWLNWFIPKNIPIVLAQMLSFLRTAFIVLLIISPLMSIQV